MAKIPQYDEFKDEDLAPLSAIDETAFKILVKRYEKRLGVYIKRSTGCDDMVKEDILQEVFIKVYRFINSFDRSLKFSSWIYRIARNEIVNFYRKNKRNREVESIDDATFFKQIESIVNESADPGSQTLHDEKKQKTMEIVYTLPDKYRDVIILRFIEEKDYSDISDIMKIPGGTVATLLNRAKKKLKKMMMAKHKWLGGVFEYE